MVAQEEFVLRPTHGESLAFHGRVIAHAEGEVSDQAFRGFKHVVTIFEADDGWLHSQIEFVSSSSSEESITAVEQKLFADNVETVLAVYEPLADVSEEQLRLMLPEEVKSLKKALRHEFDLLSMEILKQMGGFTPSVSEDKATHSKPTRSRWKHWIPFAQ